MCFINIVIDFILFKTIINYLFPSAYPEEYGIQREADIKYLLKSNHSSIDLSIEPVTKREPPATYYLFTSSLTESPAYVLQNVDGSIQLSFRLIEVPQVSQLIGA